MVLEAILLRQGARLKANAIQYLPTALSGEEIPFQTKQENDDEYYKACFSISHDNYCFV